MRMHLFLFRARWADGDSRWLADSNAGQSMRQPPSPVSAMPVHENRNNLLEEPAKRWLWLLGLLLKPQYRFVATNSTADAVVASASRHCSLPRAPAAPIVLCIGIMAVLTPPRARLDRNRIRNRARCEGHRRCGRYCGAVYCVYAFVQICILGLRLDDVHGGLPPPRTASIPTTRHSRRPAANFRPRVSASRTGVAR